MVELVDREVSSVEATQESKLGRRLSLPEGENREKEPETSKVDST